MRPELDQVTFVKVDPPPRGAAPGAEVWDFVAPDGRGVFARAEVFRGEAQWGVRLQDQAPFLEDGELLRLVSRLLVWSLACRADTVDVVLGRTHDHHALVRVGADFV